MVFALAGWFVMQTCEHENDNYLCTDISLSCFYQMFLQQKKV